jgi:hypothetical protein
VKVIGVKVDHIELVSHIEYLLQLHKVVRKRIYATLQAQGLGCGADQTGAGITIARSEQRNIVPHIDQRIGKICYNPFGTPV